ncbi:DUF3558 domain-containing protein [Nocardia beijingensis]|uniref:DUF3558 domain-containing protein n=1 Tax=Nocardia beijingensis TaxID=95162 RepID=UPI0033FFAA6C
MTGSGNTLSAIAIAAGVILAVGGCGIGDDRSPIATGSSNPANSASPSLAADVPRGFDPCTGIPADVFASENLKAKGRDDTDAPGGIMWRGCGWVTRGGNGYAVSITTTNITLDQVQAKHFADAEEFHLAGRRAISSRQDLAESGCIVSVEMNSGSLDFLVDNPKSSPDTGQTAPCQIARKLAEKVVPSVPAGA